MIGFKENDELLDLDNDTPVTGHKCFFNPIKPGGQ